MLNAYFTGFTIGFGLILAIGAQNAFVLKQGLRGEHVPAIVALCILSDGIAMFAGVSFFRVVSETLPLVEPVMRYGGAAFVAFYGLRSIHAALTSHGGLNPSDMPPRALGPTLLTCLALTWLNPHFWLDAVVLIGTLSTRFAGHEQIFALGALTSSTLFFTSLGFGARLLRPLLATPRAWQVLDIGIGAVMLVIAASLLMP